MDDPAVDPADLARALRDLRLVNRWLGGVSALLRHLSAWSERWPRSRPVTILDVGTGSGDIPLAVRAWGARHGFDLRVTALDAHPGAVAEARRRCAGTPGVTVVEADARAIPALFAPASFDYAHAGLFLHHLGDADALAVLGAMGRVARAGVIWNDLVRSRAYRTLAGVLLAGRSRIVRHDARASFDAGFARAEALELARRAGLPFLEYRRAPLRYRFTLAGERPGAWEPVP